MSNHKALGFKKDLGEISGLAVGSCPLPCLWTEAALFLGFLRGRLVTFLTLGDNFYLFLLNWFIELLPFNFILVELFLLGIELKANDTLDFTNEPLDGKHFVHQAKLHLVI